MMQRGIDGDKRPCFDCGVIWSFREIFAFGPRACKQRALLSAAGVLGRCRPIRWPGR